MSDPDANTAMPFSLSLSLSLSPLSERRLGLDVVGPRCQHRELRREVLQVVRLLVSPPEKRAGTRRVSAGAGGEREREREREGGREREGEREDWVRIE